MGASNSTLRTDLEPPGGARYTAQSVLNQPAVNDHFSVQKRFNNSVHTDQAMNLAIETMHFN